MDGSLPAVVAHIEEHDLGALMPLFVWVSPSGHIRAVGPTLAKLCGIQPLVGLRFLEVFDIRKPRAIHTMEELLGFVGQRLHLYFREPPRTAMRGHCVPLQEGQGIMVNLSFGIAVTEAVRKHTLTSADFAPTDLTVELLYLTEVKAAVMEELGALNLRLQAAQQAAEKQALTDALTGLANRRAFDQMLTRALDAVSRGGQPFALLHLDLDYFKAVNDTAGHAAGDQVLAHVAEVLRNSTRKQDVVARVGGDEFVLLLFGPTTADQVADISRRIISGLEQPITHAAHTCRISGSIGATLSDFYRNPDADRMLQDADRALYTSKHQGRAQFTVFAPESNEAQPGPSSCGNTGK